jgi:general stress protein YciG
MAAAIPARRIGLVVEDRQHQLGIADQCCGRAVARRHDRADREALAEIGQRGGHPTPEMLGVTVRIGLAAAHRIGGLARRQDRTLRHDRQQLDVGLADVENGDGRGPGLIQVSAARRPIG